MIGGRVKETYASKFKWGSAHFDSRLLTACCLVGLGYYLGAQIGFALTFQPHRVSVMWIPNSILLAAFLLMPVRTWWYILGAAFCAHLAVELEGAVPLSMVLCWFVSNSCEALIGAVLTRLLIRGIVNFDHLRNIAIFFVCGVVAAPFLSSFLDTAFVVLNHWGTEPYWQVWRVRVFSNAFTSLAVVPAIVTWCSPNSVDSKNISALRITEMNFLVTSLAIVSLTVFYTFDTDPRIAPFLLYAPLPLLLWAAMRFGVRGTATAILGVAFLAIWSAVHNHGPFLMSSPDHNALSIQLFFMVLCITLDPLAASLSERQVASEALRHSQDRYREVVESQTDLVCRYLPDTTLTFVNEAYCRFFRLHRKDLIGRRYLTLIPPEAHKSALLNVASLMVHRRPITGEHEVLVPNGTIGWQQWVDYPIEGPDGHIRELQGIGRDITARKRVETALRESEERNRAILDAIPDMMFLLNKTGIFLDYHARDERQLPAPPGQFLGKSVRDILPADLAGKVLRAFVSVLKTGQIELLEYTLQINGKDRVYEARMVRSGADKVLGVVRDITERKNAEEAQRNLTHASRLAVVGELTAVIAHEVNQPLHAILNNVEVAQLLLRTKDVPMEELRNVLADIRSDNMRASEAIRRIRTLTQKRTVSLESIEPDRLIDDLVRLIAADAQQRRVSIETRISANLPPFRADPVHLQQVLLNLAVNAMDAMDNVPETDRVLTVRAERAPDNQLVLSMSDTGPGVPPEMASRVFQSFFSTKKDGMGLGLSIARSIIEAHGGRIWCENNTAGGATFRITLAAENGAS